MPTDPVAEAIAQFGLDVVDVRPVPDSYSSTVRFIELSSGQRVVLKIPYVRRKLLREMRAIHELSDLPVPRLIDAWVPDDVSPGALLLSRLPGTVIHGALTSDLAWQMGRLLARVHTHTFPHYGDVEDAAGQEAPGWWAMKRARLDLWKPYCAQVLAPSLYSEAITLYDTLGADLPAPDGPVWTHNDYRPGNILVEYGDVTGLIDFESSRGGSADYDFTKISLEVWPSGRGTRDAFLSGYATVRPVPEIDRTLPLYQLHNALGGIAWCVRRTDTNDPFYRENLSVIEHMVAGA